MKGGEWEWLGQGGVWWEEMETTVPEQQLKNKKDKKKEINYKYKEIQKECKLQKNKTKYPLKSKNQWQRLF